MALSTDDEIKTVEMHGWPNGESLSTALDAEEDREIVGFEWSINDTSLGNSHELKCEAYVGTNPGPSTSTGDIHAKDTGGKFHTHAWSAISTDGSGYGYAANSLPSVPPGSDVTWDWNEDVTLTINLSEEQGMGGVKATFQLYYREV